MPEFILPDEADHCPHCDAVLRDPPACCESMLIEWAVDQQYPRTDGDGAKCQ